MGTLSISQVKTAGVCRPPPTSLAPRLKKAYSYTSTPL
jgi:hypothetical protein